MSALYRRSLTCLALSVVTVAAYWPAARWQFVDFDDPGYVTANPHVKSGIKLHEIRWVFTHVYFFSYQPLTLLSHMTDVQLFGLNARGHHLVNLAIHVANTLLLFVLLLQMTGANGCSAFVAAAFALHPLHVESVAWISERKDVLSTLFWMLTMI